MDTTPTGLPPMNAPLPPVTPSRHIATAAAKAKAIAPPGQPRKTPVAKRVAHDSDDEETDDVLPALGTAAPAVRSRAKLARTTATRGVTSSEQRPSRVTRSTAGAAAIRKTGTGVTAAGSPVKSSGPPPNKIPRLAATRTAKAAAAAAGPSLPAPSTATTRRMNPPPSPTPSRLPTLIPSKRPHHTSSLSEVASAATLKRGAATSDAWMTNNASAVVVPASKSERPGLRSVRRRRSSFSAADVVA